MEEDRRSLKFRLGLDTFLEFALRGTKIVYAALAQCALAMMYGP